MAGKIEEAKTILNELKTRPTRHHPLALMPIAETCSILGEKDEAFDFLETAYQERVSLLMTIGVRPALNNIRSAPRFAELLRRMGLPQGPLPKPS